MTRDRSSYLGSSKLANSRGVVATFTAVWPRRVRPLVCAILLTVAWLPTVLATPTPFPAPSTSAPVFREKPFGPKPPPLPTQAKKIEVKPGKPIPIQWIVGGIAFALVVVGIVLYRSARAWRSSNLFDRQYRFPVSDKVDLRLGAKKCGGYMATIRFEPQTPPKREN